MKIKERGLIRIGISSGIFNEEGSKKDRHPPPIVAAEGL